MFPEMVKVNNWFKLTTINYESVIVLRHFHYKAIESYFEKFVALFQLFSKNGRSLKIVVDDIMRS